MMWVKLPLLGWSEIWWHQDTDRKEGGRGDGDRSKRHVAHRALETLLLPLLPPGGLIRGDNRNLLFPPFFCHPGGKVGKGAESLFLGEGKEKKETFSGRCKVGWERE